MRWEPLVLIFLVASLSGLMILMTMSNRQHRWLALGSLAYFTGLSTILFTPLSFDGTALYVMPAGIGRVDLTHLDIFNLGFVENIVLTIPLGLLLKWAWPRLSLWGAGFLGLMVGSSIETLQYILSHHWFINRSSDINDVLSNALGVLIGATVMALVSHFLARQANKVASAQVS